MRAIIVDDELLPLLHLKKLLLNDIKDIEVIGTYLDSLEAENAIKQLRPDIIFLDIEMPILNGLQLAERIQEVNPNIEIIFVTAFDRYAVQAFKLYAIDYMMKPIQLKRLTTTVERIRTLLLQRSNNEQSTCTYLPKVSCFNSLGLQWDDGKITTMKWRTAKAQELFAYMLHHRNQAISRDTILELLWPDFDVSRGSKQLYTTIYHIRQTLKAYELEEITISRKPLDNGYHFDIGTLQMVTVHWDEQVKAFVLPTFETVEKHEQLLQDYKGDYLGEYDYLWAEGERERLRKLFLSHSQRLHTFYVAAKMTSEAIRVNEWLQQHAPFEEVSYFNLMQLYGSLGNAISVEDQYNRLKIMLIEQLDTLPSEAITSWYGQWKRTAVQ